MTGGILQTATILLVNFVTLAVSQLKPDPKAFCKLAYVFGAKGDLKEPVINDVNRTYCKSLNKTCCSEEDFKIMKDKWDSNSTNDTIRFARIQEFKDLLNMTKYLEEAEANISTISEIIKRSKIEGDPACVTPAHLQGNMATLELVKVALKQFNVTARTCWNYTQGLMNGLMCAACDYDAANFIDVNTKALTISNQECYRFIDGCGEHIKAIHAVYFYYNIYYRMTFCNNKAEFSGKSVPIMMNFPAKTMRAVDGCLNIKNYDDCAEVCRTQFGFSTMVKYENENRIRLGEFNKAIKNFTKNFVKPTTNSTNNQTEEKPTIPSTKRRARRLLPQNAIDELNQYSVIVRKYGLDLDQYTRNNLDGYREITPQEVFSSGIYTLSALAMFVVAMFTL